MEKITSDNIKIITAYSPKELNDIVDNYKKDGWVVNGSSTAATVWPTGEYEHGYVVHMQTMVKYEMER